MGWAKIISRTFCTRIEMNDKLIYFSFPCSSSYKRIWHKFKTLPQGKKHNQSGVLIVRCQRSLREPTFGFIKCLTIKNGMG